MDNRPIGIFDSGIGGLTVMKEIAEQLPYEDIIYFGDTARVPYGTRSKETIIKYTFQCINFLVSKNIKLVVIACNTATASALEEVQAHFDIPIIGVVEPGVVTATEATTNKKIGIIGTTSTINSGAYQESIRKKLSDVEVIGVSCPLFVPIVEEGWQDTEVARLTAEKYLLELSEHEIDTLVLGCTHYPILKYTISKVTDAKLINPAFETAKTVKSLLTNNNLNTESEENPKQEFYVSDDPEKFRRIGGNILNKNIKNIAKIDIEDFKGESK